MTKNGAGIKHPKLRGEWAEMRFMARAAENGYQVSKPWGETARYDFVVEAAGRFVRVQVKSTMFRDRGGYSCSVRGCRGPYVGDVFDFLAVYLILEDLWYIVPADLVRGQGSIAVYPRLKKSKYGAYREAWDLLRGGRVESIEACEENPEMWSASLADILKIAWSIGISACDFSGRGRNQFPGGGHGEKPCPPGLSESMKRKESRGESQTRIESPQQMSWLTKQTAPKTLTPPFIERRVG